jgi:hypothetical protein
MILRFWSVPIISESRLDLPGPMPNQRRVQTTTTYDLGGRRLHALEVKVLKPGPVLVILGISLLFFVPLYAVTIFVPGIILAITKNNSLGWLFFVWAVPVLGLAVSAARGEYLTRKRMKFALAERGLTAKAKLQLVTDEKWDRWVAQLK